MSIKKHLPSFAAGLLLGGIFLIGWSVWADGDPSTDTVPRMIPYQGVLELNGQPVNASSDDPVWVQFNLFDGNGVDAPLVYTQQNGLAVYGGRFTTTIGPEGDNGVQIAEVIRSADDLYLGMTLLGELLDDGDDIVLANRQRIMATPYAMWTTAATDLTVARALNVGGNAVVQGDLTVSGDVALPNGVISSAELAGTVAGAGLTHDTNAMGVDTTWLDDRIRSWVRSNCRIHFGWRDNCSGCANGPAKHGSARVDGSCSNTDIVGADSKCRGDWVGINADGDVSGDDVFYIKMLCD